MPTATATRPTNGAPLTGAPACPKCGGMMWDNRATKRNPKAPDFKCRDRSCDGVFWPGQYKGEAATDAPRPQAVATEPAPARGAEAGKGGTPPARGSERATERTTRRQALRACYLDVTDIVLAEVRPRYEKAGVPCSDATAAAIVATLFIATCRVGDA